MNSRHNRAGRLLKAKWDLGSDGLWQCQTSLQTGHHGQNRPERGSFILFDLFVVHGWKTWEIEEYVWEYEHATAGPPPSSHRKRGSEVCFLVEIFLKKAISARLPITRPFFTKALFCILYEFNVEERSPCNNSLGSPLSFSSPPEWVARNFRIYFITCHSSS